MVHQLANMAFSIYDIIVNWMNKHSDILSEHMVLLMLEDEGLDIRESYKCINLLKNNGFIYSPTIGKIAVVR